MNRDQFLRALRQHCKRNTNHYDWRPGEGKVSHGTVYVNGRKTIVKSGELPKDYVNAVLKQLGLDRGSL